MGGPSYSFFLGKVVSKRVHLILFHRKRFTLSEVLDVLEDDEVFQSAQIFLQPPGEGDKSDEDSDEEEGGDLNHLSRDLLQSNIDFTINYGNEITNTLEEEVVETVPHEVIKTNVDEISVEWDEDTFNECKKTMRQFIPLLKKLKKTEGVFLSSPDEFPL